MPRVQPLVDVIAAVEVSGLLTALELLPPIRRNPGGRQVPVYCCTELEEARVQADIPGGNVRNERAGFADRCLTLVLATESAIVRLRTSDSLEIVGDVFGR